MTQHDPSSRWLDSDAPEAIREGLASYGTQGPTDDALARILAGVEQTVEPGHDGSGDHGPSTPSSGAHGAHGLGLKLWLGGGLLSAAVLSTWLWSGEKPPVQVPPAPALVVQPLAAPAAIPETAVDESPAELDAVVEATDPEIQPPTPAKPEATAAPRRRPAKPKVRTIRPAAAEPSPSDPAAELVLLQRARRRLHAAPGEALALVAEHERRFAGGMFVQEREVLAIEALLAKGLRGQAASRAAHFREAHPSSTHLRRLDQLLDPH